MNNDPTAIPVEYLYDTPLSIQPRHAIAEDPPFAYSREQDMTRADGSDYAMPRRFMISREASESRTVDGLSKFGFGVLRICVRLSRLLPR